MSESHHLYISDTTLIEIFQYQKRIIRLSKLNDEAFENLKTVTIQKVTIIWSSFISDDLVVESYKLVKKIDLTDFAFVATTKFVNGYL